MTLTPLLAAIPVAIAIFAIVGWALERPLFASWGQSWIPMAPSAALLFVLTGAALFCNAGDPASRPARRAGIAIGSAAALIGLAIFVLDYLGIRLDVEHLGLRAAGTINGVPTGHMSRMTALCFFVSGLSLVASLLSSPERQWPAMAGYWLAGLMAFASVVFLLAYVFGMPLFYEGPFIPPALPTTIALVALGSGLLQFSGMRAWLPDPEMSAEDLRTSRAFVLVFSLMAAGMVLTGAMYFRSQVAQRHDEIESQLSAVAKLKIDEIVNWRRELMGDASLLHRNPAFAGLVRRAFGTSRDAQAQAQLRLWLTQIRDGLGYEKVSLVDAQGVTRIVVPEGSLAAGDLDGARRALRSDQIRIEDLHWDQAATAPRMALLVPILELAGRAVGAVTLEIDPRRYLYPLLERWPVPSRSAETLLVRRDGTDVLFLNDLRFRENAALSMRFPLTQTDLPAAMAVLGQQGIVQGTDYRGLAAIAAIRPVPGTPWFLVARVSAWESFERTAQAMGLAAGVAATVLFSAGLALGIILRQRRAIERQERSRADMLEKSALEVARYSAELETSGRNLARSNLELEQFAYIASHDLQEPLRMVTSYLQLVEKRLADKLDADTREFMGYAVDGAKRMQHLIQDILAYSRVGRGRPLAPVDSGAALKEALALLASRVAETGTEVKAEALPVVLADRTQLVQLFQNLVGNAIKFCKDGAPRVRVAAEQEAGRWRFSVTDNGIGIAPEYRGQLFIVFKRLHTRREYPGTGIGLAICKRIVERHGGEIGVESAPGRGSVFWFTLAEEIEK